MTCSNLLFKKFFKLFSLPELDKAHQQIFCRFPPELLQGFPLSKPVSPLCPSFCILFHVFMHLFMHFIGIFGTIQIGIFDDSSHFFWNWSFGFVPIMLKSWSMMFNLINLVFCEKLKILGLVFIRIWGFCSNWFQLMKLACWIDIIDHYFM